MAKKAPDPGRDIVSGGIGVAIGVVLFFMTQAARDQIAANPFSGFTTSSHTASNLAYVTAFAVLFVVAGAFYLARGLAAQQRAQGLSQSQAPSDTAQRPLVECPVCKEQIRYGAEKCRFCGSPIQWP